MSFQPSYQFHHVHIFCSDLGASEEWFVQKLGAEIIQRRNPKPSPAVDLSLGGATLFLREQWPDETLGAGGSPRFGTDHIGLLVNDLDATAEELKNRGVFFEVDPYVIRPGLKIAFIQGPDQLRIELLQRV